MADTPLALAQQLRLLMETRGLTQSEVAQRSGAHESTVSLLLRGKRQPSLDMLTRVAVALDATVLVTLVPKELVEGA